MVSRGDYPNPVLSRCNKDRVNVLVEEGVKDDPFILTMYRVDGLGGSTGS